MHSTEWDNMKETTGWVTIELTVEEVTATRVRERLNEMHGRDCEYSSHECENALLVGAVLRDGGMISAFEHLEFDRYDLSDSEVLAHSRYSDTDAD